MDLMDVPEPGASADPWGAGAGAGAAAASADPWQPYGIYIHTHTLALLKVVTSCDIYILSLKSLCMCVKEISALHLQLAGL